jgi:pilus assembly protein CpaF
MTDVELHAEVCSPAGKRAVSLAGPGPHWVGRDPDCAITLAASNISRHHLSIQPSRGGFDVVDASSNGSVVNDTLLHRDTRHVAGLTVTLCVGVFSIRVWYDALECALDAGKRIIVQPPVDTPSSQRQGAQLQQDHPASAPDMVRQLSAEGKASKALLRRQIHRRLLENLDLPSRGRNPLDPIATRPEVVAALRRIVAESEGLNHVGREVLVHELADEALGLGPLERFLADSEVSEIMVVDSKTLFVERRGKLELTGCEFTDDDAIRAVIERIVTPLGRRIDESTPLVDARLKDGSRVNAVIPPLAIRGPCITIRKFAKEPLTTSDLVGFGSFTPEIARFLERAVKARKNIVISGGTGSGKTTLLNVLSASIPSTERVVTVEDAAELRLSQPHVVSLEARPPNLEGNGEYSIRDLVKNALRMRPDRIVVGECRGSEAIDMLQAMNTGHEGSLTTTHANSPREALARIETLCLMAGLDLPVRAIRQQIASSIHVIVQQSRFSDGSRRVTHVSEVVGLGDDGDVQLRDIFEFKATGTSDSGQVQGTFSATGYLPSFIDEFIVRGLITDGEFL